jgi:hypothetical protein
MKLVEMLQTKRGTILQLILMNLQQNSKNKNIIYFHMASMIFMGYHLRTLIVKNEKDAVVANPDRGLVMWMNHFSELLNAPGVNGDRQNEINIAGPLVPDPSAFEFVMATES